MKKITLILTLVSLVGLLSLSSIAPSQAWATNDGLPQIDQPDGNDDFEELIFEQNDGPNGGNEGDPDTTLDGPLYSGQGMFQGWDLEGLSLEAIMEWILVQLIPAP